MTIMINDTRLPNTEDNLLLKIVYRVFSRYSSGLNYFRDIYFQIFPSTVNRS